MAHRKGVTVSEQTTAEGRAQRLAELRELLAGDWSSSVYIYGVDKFRRDAQWLLTELDAATAAAADRMQEAGCARLWLVDRTDRPDWDQYSAAVIAADTEAEALETAKAMTSKVMALWGEKPLKVEAVGWASPGLRGVVLSDFKAG